MSQMSADFQALSSEAAEWDTTSEALTTAADEAAALTLSASQFSFISLLTGVETSYAAAQQRVVDVCRAGATETAKIADALRQVRADFHSSDQGVVDDVSALWVPE